MVLKFPPQIALKRARKNKDRLTELALTGYGQRGVKSWQIERQLGRPLQPGERAKIQQTAESYKQRGGRKYKNFILEEGNRLRRARGDPLAVRAQLLSRAEKVKDIKLQERAKVVEKNIKKQKVPIKQAKGNIKTRLQKFGTSL